MSIALFNQCLLDSSVFAGSRLFMRDSVFRALQNRTVRKGIQDVLHKDEYVDRGRIMAFISVLVESFILAEDMWDSCGLNRTNMQMHQSRRLAVLKAVKDFESVAPPGKCCEHKQNIAKQSGG